MRNAIHRRECNLFQRCLRRQRRQGGRELCSDGGGALSLSKAPAWDAGAQGWVFRFQNFQKLPQHIGDRGFKKTDGDMQRRRIAGLRGGFMHHAARQIKRITGIEGQRMRRAARALLIGPRCGAAW